MCGSGLKWRALGGQLTVALFTLRKMLLLLRGVRHQRGNRIAGEGSLRVERDEIQLGPALAGNRFIGRYYDNQELGGPSGLPDPRVW